MSVDPNKTYHLVNPHSGKGLSYEVYASYDYVREVEGAGTALKFEPVDEYRGYKIRMTGSNWANYNYLTKSGKEWIYLDTKDNATIWTFQRDNEGDITRIWEKNNSDTANWRYYESGSKKWLGTDEYDSGIHSPLKRFKIVAAG
ncbi:hypothetical protein RH165_27035 [Priestia megaterium]|uniref:hypothetical protein n=1 Tax=Priestia megaterium TaxID=1404 RepID=UPI002E1A15B5|nr:hypothetical protein [Priestia megaterium]MED5121714.1 hypothetical protein [Priestia megaterium]